MSLPPNGRLDHYEIIVRMGAGGMGEVYRARDTRLGRELAIKVLPQEIAAHKEGLNRFKKEAHLASSLNHPNIVTIYDIGWADGTPYIAMELVEGRTLREILKLGPMAIGDVLDVARQMTDGLAKVHEAGIVHRDLKPENVMITGDGLVKILDFGLGKHIAPIFDAANGATVTAPLTSPGTILGTVEYMSPEQAAGREVDFHSDQFSFGSMLYEMVTGSRPFHRDTPVQTMSAIIGDEPQPLFGLTPTAPAPFREIVERCLAKDPENRFPSTQNLHKEIRDLSSVQYQSKEVSFPGILMRGKRWMFRTLMSVVAVVALGLALTGVVTTESLRRLWSGPPATETTIPDLKHLVILPFRAIGGEPSSQIFANGLTETLTAKLTQLTILPSLQVAPASEVRRRQIESADEARKFLGANLIVVGSIEQSGGSARVNCSLIDASTGRELGTRTISAENSDPLTMQDQLVAAIAQMLGLELQPSALQVLEAQDTEDAAAKELYLQARGYLQDFDKAENIDRALSGFEDALEMDPGYAAAAAGIGEAYWRTFESSKETKWVEEAQTACEHALSLDQNLAAAHGCLGIVHQATGRYEEAVSEFQEALEVEPTNDNFIRELAGAQEGLGKPEEAENTYQRAITFRPHYWANYNGLGAFYYGQARYREAAEMFEQVVRLAPDNVFGYNNLGGTYVLLGQYGDAIPIFDRSVAIRPTAAAHSNLATAYFFRRRFLDAAQSFEQGVKLNQENHTIWGNLGDAYYWAPGKRPQAADAYRQAISLGEERLTVNPRDVTVLGQVAGYYAMIGEKQPALDRLQQALEIAPADAGVLFKAAIVHVQFNEVDETLNWLEKAGEAGYSWTTVRDAPNFDHLWGNPRFQQLLRGQ